MPSRILVAKEMGEIFKVLAHPDRIRLIEELRAGEKDVNTLSERLELPSPRVSQHLGLLRLHRIVAERREGEREREREREKVLFPQIPTNNSSYFTLQSKTQFY